MVSLTDLFNPTFLIILGILLLVAALLVIYVESKMRDQNHKIASMLSLVSTLAEDMNGIKMGFNQIPRVVTRMGGTGPENIAEPLENSKMVLTPTYYVFDMYKVHQGALHIPLEIQCDSMEIGKHKVPSISASASKDSKGLIHITLANINPDKGQNIIVDLPAENISKVSGTILTAKSLNSYNTFENKNLVIPKTFKNIKIASTGLYLNVPAQSIISSEVKSDRP